MEHILPFAEEYDLLPREGLIICALSGGADSVALLHFLKEHGFRVVAAHFNHHLRPTARRDAEFCRDLCKDWGVPFFTWGKRVGEEPGNVEANARAARYAYFEHLAAGLHAARIATAHNANDNLETVLLHMTRGCGLQGLCGIQPRRGLLVRPMLHTTRAAVEEYVRAHGLPFVTDETNLDDRYARNRIRHQVIPVLESLNPRAVEAAARMTDRLRLDQERLGPWSPEVPPEPLPELEPTQVTVGQRVETPLWTLETAWAVCPDAPPTPARFYLKPRGELTLRSRRTGDRLRPPFRAGKSLNKWFIELGVPRWQRPAVPVLVSGEDVLAAAGVGPAASALARPGEDAVLVEWLALPEIEKER